VNRYDPQGLVGISRDCYAEFQFRQCRLFCWRRHRNCSHGCRATAYDPVPGRTIIGLDCFCGPCIPWYCPKTKPLP
jgi:hypothetical protein